MNNNEKAFVILTPGFASSEADTSCLPMQQHFVRTLSAIYPELDIIILSFHYPFYHAIYRWHDATVYSFNGRNRGGAIRFILRSRVNTALNKLRQKKEVIGILSFWLGECALVGKMFSRKWRIPHYCWLLGQDARLGNSYVRKAAINGEELIALSDFLQDEFQRNYGIRPATVILPGIEGHPGDLCEVRDIDLLAVGSLIPLKQPELFIGVVAELVKVRPRIRALLIGDGLLEQDLKRLIRSMELQHNITLTGKLPNEMVLANMRRARILLHPSSYEGFSGVCLEALTAGAHVVSFCRPMHEDIENWHVVHSTVEMVQKSEALLKMDLKPEVFTFQPMSQTVKQIMELMVKRQSGFNHLLHGNDAQRLLFPGEKEFAERRGHL